MKPHPRYLPVQQADNDLDKAVCDLIERYSLTHLEVISVLNQVIARWVKYGVERLGTMVEKREK